MTERELNNKPFIRDGNVNDIFFVWQSMRK